MKQEDLGNLKIEDLEEVIEGYWIDSEEMLVSDGESLYLCDVIAINQKRKGDYKVITTTGFFKKAYKIPKPKMRNMNSLEVMEYLHLLQLKLNRVDIKLLHFDFVNDEFFKNRNLLQNGGFDSGVVVYSVGSNDNYGDWANYSSFWVFIDDMSYKFGILKNGKVTEFKILQIEV